MLGLRAMGAVALVGAVVGLLNLLGPNFVLPGWRTAAYAAGLGSLLVLSILLVSLKRFRDPLIVLIILLSAPFYLLIRICLVEGAIFAPPLNMIISMAAAAVWLSTRWFIVQCVIVSVTLAVSLAWDWHHPIGTLIAQFVSQGSVIIGVGVGMFVLLRRVERLLANLRQATMTDELTGLPNRREIKVFAQGLTADTANPDAARLVAVVVFDIDRFKAVNDRFGHQVGDEVLRAVAHRVGTTRSARTLVCRLGGEEFSVISEVADHAEARELVEQVRALVADAGGPVPVTASAGLAVEALPTKAGIDIGEWLWTVINDADQALYHAKEAGRDQYSVMPTHRLRTRRPVPVSGGDSWPSSTAEPPVEP